ncbi:type I polyketide synthase [Chitinophaga flava]|uniref:Polyketide synthase n=1 Tax=Chitinophaga flava TaxID=2259036 RepID=A0A365XUM1_9BACT|nr:type I polyketide synthase [Chitinophaga flava]RBL90066.1 polyketide synthase [Chitinophaga flava]
MNTEIKQAARKKDIAIIGLAGRFPQSEHIQAFWKNLTEGKELVRFFTPEELLQKGIDKSVIDDKSFIPCSASLDNAESFDYSFFGYTLEEASLMDPQIRVMHEQVWAALDDAGYTKHIDRETIGLFLAASDNLNWRAYAMMNPSEKVTPFIAARMANRDFISTMIAYKLGLKGPAYHIDTACSGALSAVHLACRSLLLKECSLSVAGGVSIYTQDTGGYFYKEGMIASKDGHCRAFDEQASGTIWGEGAAAVVLKRYDDAVRDGDHIYAVIRSSATNNDGKRKVGYTAPSVEGQAECIRLAHRIADVTPASIGYVEAHGTGTRLGDPIEIEALNKAFNFDTTYSCAIGSVKTNMGHLDAAAGVTGLIKASLSLKHRTLVPSLHFTKPNPEISFQAGPFYVNTQFKKWEPLNGTPLRAGVSSFGIGGTNVHVVLEEAPVLVSGGDTKPFYPLLYSGKTKTSLKNYKQKLREFLPLQQEGLPDLSYTSAVKRMHHKYRDAVIATDVEDILSKLSRDDSSRQSDKTLYPAKDVVFMFPGQGSQYFGMAQELYRHQPVFSSWMDKGLQTLQELSGISFREIIGYAPGDNADQQQINNTLYTQPLLFLVEYAMAQTLIHMGVKPASMIGHSLGEYVAACLSGVFSFEDGLKIIWERARLMNSLPGGSMLAVNAGREEVSPLLTNNISVAVINTKDTCVVAGNTEEIDALAMQLTAQGIVCTRLRTSHAFHSRMMDGILPAFEQLLSGISLSAPQIPFISNRSGKAITAEEAVSPAYWVTHLREAVLFSAGLQSLLHEAKDSTIFVEVGPGKTLTGFLKQQENYDAGCRVFSTVRPAREHAHDYGYFLNTLADLWKNGLSVDWEQLYVSENRKKVPVLTYAFDRTALPLKVKPFEQLKQLKNGTPSLPVVQNPIQQPAGSEYDEQPERPELSVSYQPPENEVQRKLCEIWQSFLGFGQIGIYDNFFELGGDSLRAMSLLSRIQKEFNVVVNLQDFYTNANIKDISTEIDIALKLSSIKKESANRNKIKI